MKQMPMAVHCAGCRAVLVVLVAALLPSSATATLRHPPGLMLLRKVTSSKLRGSMPVDLAGTRWPGETMKSDVIDARDAGITSTNVWTGEGKHMEFRFVDDLEPVAPMDRIVSADMTVHTQIQPDYTPAMFVPPYLFTETFPRTYPQKVPQDRNFTNATAAPPAAAPPAAAPTALLGQRFAVNSSSSNPDWVEAQEAGETEVVNFQNFGGKDFKDGVPDNECGTKEKWYQKRYKAWCDDAVGTFMFQGKLVRSVWCKAKPNQGKPVERCRNTKDFKYCNILFYTCSAEKKDTQRCCTEYPGVLPGAPGGAPGGPGGPGNPGGPGGPGGPGDPDDPFKGRDGPLPPMPQPAVPTFMPPTIPPEDLTWHRGSKWWPAEVRRNSGIMAPEDKIPWNHQPLLAPADKFMPLPPTATEDRIPHRFSRYIDQLYDRSNVCDKTSVNCTFPCEAGHNVTINQGNTDFPAQIVGPQPGNTFLVRYAAAAARKCGDKCDKGVIHCKTEDGCSAFRPCLTASNTGCTALRDASEMDFQNNLIHKEACPPNSKLCTTIEQVIPAEQATLWLPGVDQDGHAVEPKGMPCRTPETTG